MSRKGNIASADQGLLTYWASFTDGASGLFQVAVPAPSAAGLLALGGLAAMGRRRAPSTTRGM